MCWIGLVIQRGPELSRITREAPVSAEYLSELLLVPPAPKGCPRHAWVLLLGIPELSGNQGNLCVLRFSHSCGGIYFQKSRARIFLFILFDLADGWRWPDDNCQQNLTTLQRNQEPVLGTLPISSDLWYL